MIATSTDDLPPGFTYLRQWYHGPDLQGALARELPWAQESIRVYGRAHAVPRLTCWLGDGAPYTYSGITHHPAPWHPMVAALRAEIDALLCSGRESSFNSCLGNLYRDGSHSVAWHADDEPELGDEPLIASLSLGAARRFKIRERSNHARVWDLELGHGDLLVMCGRSQADYEHAVPRTARAVGERINLTFRQIRACGNPVAGRTNASPVPT